MINQDNQSLKHVPPGFEHELKNIAIDFDGVIHEFLGWGDGTCYGQPLEGSIEAIKQLSKNWNIIIFTAKARPDRPLVNGKTGTELVYEWLEKYDLTKHIDYVTHEKPRAEIYVDDKGLRFHNWKECLEQLKTLNIT
tara:strand:- start:1589 stop:1999 length:411 start_codon:yes stop_codon:yes gene_type:complete